MQKNPQMFKGLKRIGGSASSLKGSFKGAAGGAASSFKTSFKNSFKRSAKGLTGNADKIKSAKGSVKGSAKSVTGNADKIKSGKGLGKSVAGNADRVKSVKSVKGVARRAGAVCRRNPRKCAAAGAGAGLAVYAAQTYAEQSDAQWSCILECLPPNWDGHRSAGEVPEYYTVDDDDAQPYCTDGDCDATCRERCEALHPTTPASIAAGAVTNAVNDLAVSVLQPLLDLLPFDVWGTVMGGARVIIGILGLLVLSYVHRFLNVFRSLVGGWAGHGVAAAVGLAVLYYANPALTAVGAASLVPRLLGVFALYTAGCALAFASGARNNANEILLRVKT